MTMRPQGPASMWWLDPFSVTKQDLVMKMSIEQIEANECVHDPLGAVPSEPFGFLCKRWQAIRSALRPRDALWSFRALRPIEEGGAPHMSRVRVGYAVVRRGKVADSLITGIFIERHEDTSGTGQSSAST